MSGSYFQPIKREFLNLSGGTVTGETAFTSGLTIINGNVGIGTATPETTLQVLAPTALLAEEISRFGISGVTGSSVSIINATSISGQFTPSLLSINSETNRNAFLFYGAGGLDTGTIAISTFDSRIVTSGSSYPNYGWSAATTRPLFRWANNGSAQMTMSAAGNLGIGAATPTAKLHINNTTTGTTFLAEDSSNPDATPFIIDTDGNVGIGIAVPSANLHINNTTTGTTFLVEDSSNPDSTPFIIDTSGNVGIGTTTPSTLLDVQGSNSTYFRFSPTASGGRVLLSGATSTTSSPAYAITIPISSGSSLSADAQFGIISFDNTTSQIFGRPGDTYIRSSSRSNGLNLITEPLAGTGTTQDYIRFYAGQNASGTTPDIHIQGTGTTRGFVGIGTATPNRPLHVRDVMRLEPRNTEPSNPAEGDIYFDSILKKLRVFDGTTWQNCW